MIAGIVLAAGESKRMGQFKLLLPWNQTSIIRQVVANTTESRLGAVIVVLGFRAQDVAAELGTMPVSVTVNPDFKLGMSSSLKCGLRYAPDEAAAFMILLGDAPLVTANIINLLIDRYWAGGYGIVIPVYAGKRGHPVIFDRKYKQELLALADNRGANEVVRQHAPDVLEVPVESENILIDIDTPQDYEHARRLNNQPGYSN